MRKPDGTPADDVRIIAQLAPPPEVIRRPETGTQYYEAPPPTRITFTDAQGRYRLENVPPGRYYIVAGLLGQATYYPGSPEDNHATIVNVTSGSSMDLDFTLATPLGGRVFGRVTPASPDGTQERAVVSGPEMAEVLELPIHADGTFDLGHLPKGRYLMNIFPIYPGLTSQAFDVGDADVPPLTFVRPPLRTVSGRVVVDRGPVPITLLGFVTPDDNFIAAKVEGDGSFRVRLQPATHRPDVAGMPAGYSVVSVKANGKDISAGLVVDKSDISDVVVTIAAPDNLPALHGRVTGVPAARLNGRMVEMTADGAIAGTVSAPITSAGTFEFAALTPGLYALTIPGVIDKPINVVVTFFGENTVTVAP
ncbi:MAG TPA: carboxypeptidase-like regulatory domain-containing protein [Vicinamibacterales bacterium]|nr:carboxypeptidase-like regulatory domain-containing protein [Vicinamibacterales bacterium]